LVAVEAVATAMNVGNVVVHPCRIGLGSVQFGADYGISNRMGQPSSREVADILLRAVEMGVGYLDTAIGYGDAELLIGRYLPPSHCLRIVTKIASIGEERISSGHRHSIVASIEASLDRLRADRAYGVLVHNASDLAKEGWQHLVEALHEIRSRGLSARIGASVYDDQQLALVESRLRPEIIQLPMNILDRRLLRSGAVRRLKAQGTEVHARSVFLQGLLLMAPGEVPGFFAPIRLQLATIRQRWLQYGIKPVAGCLGFVLQQEDVAAAIIGINRPGELDDIRDAFDLMSRVDIDVGLLADIDPIYLDASRWPRLRH
jgi:aryl-alcohol dehydrogenase-like predicted oxidoreductase